MARERPPAVSFRRGPGAASGRLPKFPGHSSVGFPLNCYSSGVVLSIPHEQIPQHDEHHEQHNDNHDDAEEQSNHLSWSETRHRLLLHAGFSMLGTKAVGLLWKL